MHHIYCESKKSYIVSAAASRSGLRGVYLFGKPGRVVVEGPGTSAVLYAKKVKQLKWQKCHIAFVGEYQVEVSDNGAAPFYLPSDGMTEIASDRELEALLRNCEIGLVYEALSCNWGSHSGEARLLPCPVLKQDICVNSVRRCEPG